MGAVMAAFRAAAENAGATIRAAAPAARILVEKGRAVGVVLEDGEEISAGRSCSAVNPNTTFLDLVGPRDLDTGFVRKIGNMRMKGDAAKLHLALDRPPQFPGLPLPNIGAAAWSSRLRSTMSSAPSTRPNMANSRPNR